MNDLDKAPFGMELPPDYCWIRQGRVTLAVLRAYRDRLLELPVLDLPRLLSLEGTDQDRFTGRGGVASVEFDAQTGERMIIRGYRHGGLLRAVTGRLLLGPRRPMQELMTGHLAEKMGVPTAKILGASVERRFLFFYFGTLFTLEVEGAKDLNEVLAGFHPNPSRKETHKKWSVLRAAAGAIRSLHDCEIFHPDLNLKNVIIRDRGGDRAPEALVIDLDRARRIRSLSWSHRWKNLFRLHRSLEKLTGARRQVTRSDQVRFLTTYLGRRLQGDHDLRRRIRWHRMALAFHRLGWRRPAKGA